MTVAAPTPFRERRRGRCFESRGPTPLRLTTPRQVGRSKPAVLVRPWRRRGPSIPRLAAPLLGPSPSRGTRQTRVRVARPSAKPCRAPSRRVLRRRGGVLRAFEANAERTPMKPACSVCRTKLVAKPREVVLAMARHVHGEWRRRGGSWTCSNACRRQRETEAWEKRTGQSWSARVEEGRARMSTAIRSLVGGSQRGDR